MNIFIVLDVLVDFWDVWKISYITRHISDTDRTINSFTGDQKWNSCLFWGVLQCSAFHLFVMLDTTLVLNSSYKCRHSKLQESIFSFKLLKKNFAYKIENLVLLWPCLPAAKHSHDTLHKETQQCSD